MAPFTQDDPPISGTWATCGFTGRILMPSKLAGMLHEHLFDLPGDPWSSAGYLFVKNSKILKIVNFLLTSILLRDVMKLVTRKLAESHTAKENSYPLPSNDTNFC